MTNLKDVIGYICANYPHKDELSDARITKMIYLADWKSALDRSTQITAINWKFNHYGPYVDDIKNLTSSDSDFEVHATSNIFGGYKKLISLRNNFTPESLQAEDKALLNHVIETTSSLTWDGFIKLVYSTLPVVVSERGSQLNLVETAQKYKSA